MNKKTICLLAAGIGLAPLVNAVPLTIDVTPDVPPAAACPYGPGTTKNPRGEEITADQHSLFLNGQPWMPIVGEFHYSRYPAAEWRDELLKMKAGGLNTVSTYVFWIHHEEEKGKWDWSGQRSLRDFIKTAQEVGLKVIVRLGPWAHGEVRNGGFPDWVQNSGVELRKDNPAFLKLVEPLFAEEAKQMQGLLWKDGGPIIGVQLDNECRRADYLLSLKKMALAAGVDVPLYTITGWQGGLPNKELLPLFGGYVDGFWGGTRENYRKEFLFNEVRAMNDLGAQLTGTNPANNGLISQFPYACAEIGGGMNVSYARRIKIAPADIAALALGKLGSGNNMPGYYMYHGGVNPDGKLTTLQEDHPNQMPVKDYDFQAPLGAAGQVRAQYFLLREQHLFMQDFGAQLARLTAFFPEKKPADLHDFDTVRWDVRSDGKSGFLFFSNEQPYDPLPEHRDVQFEVKTKSGPILIPSRPMTIPAGSMGVLPVNMDCNGVVLAYATAQPLCLVSVGATSVFFFAALAGIPPELAIREGAAGPARVLAVTPGTAVAGSQKNAAGRTVAFVVLTPDQARQLARVNFGGQERVALSEAVAVADAGGLRLLTDHPADLELAMFPPAGAVKAGGAVVNGKPDGIFARYHFGPFPALAPATVTATQEKPPGPRATSLKGTEEATWEDAAVYQLNFPAGMASRPPVLNIEYTGDAARLYVGERLFDDNFYNGDAFAVALWRIPASEWSRIRLKILPYSDGLAGRLPAQGKEKVERAKSESALDRVTVYAVEPRSLQVASVAP